VGIPLYLLAWLLLPSDRTPSVAQQRGWNRNTIVALTLVVAVGFVSIAVIGENGPAWFFPWFLIGLGIWFLARDRQPSTSTTVATAPAAAPGSDLVGSPASAPFAPGDVTEPVPPATSRFAPKPFTPGPQWAPAPPPPPEPARRPFLTPLTLFALVAFGGIAIAVGGGRWSEPGVVASVGLLTIGAVLLLSAWLGRARGLIVCGIILVFPVIVSLTAGDAWRDWDANATVRPATVGQLEDHYEWGFGRRVLDLRDLRLVPGSDVRVEVDQIAGELEVLLPEDTTTRLEADVGAGNLQVEVPAATGLDRSADGLGVDMSQRIVTGDGRATLDLEIDLGAGDLRVRAEQPRTARDDQETPR
jgi:hypothetical protein